MIVYGYAKGYKYRGDGTFQVQVRIPSIHGPYKQQNANGQIIRNYVYDDDLPWYDSVILPSTPNEGEVVMLMSTNESDDMQWVVIGLTGGSYNAGLTSIT